MADMPGSAPKRLPISLADLRAVATFAALSARTSLEIFEQVMPGDLRPRHAIEAAQAFAEGAERTKVLRDGAWAAMRAAHDARDASHLAASESARAAMAAAGSAFLHPLFLATQVKHILGSAGHALRSMELVDGGSAVVPTQQLAKIQRLASPGLVAVLRRYPAAPAGGGRVGEIVRLLDKALRTEPGRISDGPTSPL